MLIAAIIPAYKVTEQILSVIARIGPEVHSIYVVDDACPHGSGDHVAAHCTDARVKVLRHEVNQGVGGAVITGYTAALEDGAAIMVKVDGDGQMKPELIPLFVAPLLAGKADYAKGNRFYDLTHINQMPTVRLIGNAALSFMAKLSTGYWHLFDPTNGFTALHAKVARRIDFSKVSRRYFFETDLLFRLSIGRAMAVDIPMDAHYAEEKSNLKIGKVLGEFFAKHVRNLLKRLFYNYFLRDMSVASFELLFGTIFLAFGVPYGLYHWIHSAQLGVSTPIGTIMLAALSIMFGVQFMLAFIAFDVANQPNRPVHPDLPE